MNTEEQLIKTFEDFMELESIHFNNAMHYSYGYLIGFRHSDSSLRETKKEEAFYHAGMAEAYRRCKVSINEIITKNDEKEKK